MINLAACFRGSTECLLQQVCGCDPEQSLSAAGGGGHLLHLIVLSSPEKIGANLLW